MPSRTRPLYNNSLVHLHLLPPVCMKHVSDLPALLAREGRLPLAGNGEPLDALIDRHLRKVAGETPPRG